MGFYNAHLLLFLVLVSEIWPLAFLTRLSTILSWTVLGIITEVADSAKSNWMTSVFPSAQRLTEILLDCQPLADRLWALALSRAATSSGVRRDNLANISIRSEGSPIRDVLLKNRGGV